MKRRKFISLLPLASMVFFRTIVYKQKAKYKCICTYGVGFYENPENNRWEMRKNRAKSLAHAMRQTRTMKKAIWENYR